LTDSNPSNQKRDEAVSVIPTDDPAMIPAPSGSPVVFAFGTTLMFAGLVTNPWVTVVGVICTIAGIIGWWRDVLPREAMELIPADEYREIDTGPEITDPVHHAASDAPARMVLPVEVPRIGSGVIGGLCGGVAMAVIALIWGAIQGSIWLPVNLLAAMVLSSYDTESLESLSTFQTSGLLSALGIHIAFSIMIGLLLGAMMPMASRWPMLFACIIAPIVWSMLTYAGMGVLDPTLEKYVDWWWFFGSQFAFGIVAGVVIGRSEKISVVQYLSPAERFQLERNKGEQSGTPTSSGPGGDS
jgi:hypothetical protein